VGPLGKGRMEGEKREGKGGEGVPECPNSELASLMGTADALTAECTML